MNRTVALVTLAVCSLLGSAATQSSILAAPATATRPLSETEVRAAATIADFTRGIDGGVPGLLEPPPPPPPPPPPTPREALEKGVLIVVSIPSQTAFVFRRGEEWDWTRVSTGKPGNDTPTGAFPILQKKLHHRSNLYDDAPMPFMQRLTWDGVALHAGRATGRPISHGCIRLPEAFARKLYEVTNFSSTLVVVTDTPLASAQEARKLA
ncbi:MAG TPA: L,D-transpeptidase family protein [Beijerinckiaceae bacterium]|nr:L,D-transpeptidase family protein [Beijerinckiaceae bacterium]